MESEDVKTKEEVGSDPQMGQGPSKKRTEPQDKARKCKRKKTRFGLEPVELVSLPLT